MGLSAGIGMLSLQDLRNVRTPQLEEPRIVLPELGIDLRKAFNLRLQFADQQGNVFEPSVHADRRQADELSEKPSCMSQPKVRNQLAFRLGHFVWVARGEQGDRFVERVSLALGIRFALGLLEQRPGFRYIAGYAHVVRPCLFYRWSYSSSSISTPFQNAT